MNIAIVEDQEAHSSLLRRYVSAWGEARGKAVHVRIYPNAGSFLFDLEDSAPDAVFADIQMPGMNGMEMVRRLRERDGEMPVVFTSGLSDYLQEGYEVQALHYLIKPISEEKVFDCMDRIWGRTYTSQLYTVKTPDGMAKLDLKEVNYCEAQGHYTEFVMTDRSGIRAARSISELERELPGDTFVRCHRSFLCNLGNVKRIAEESVVFDNGDCAPVSRRLYREINRSFIEFYRRQS